MLENSSMSRAAYHRLPTSEPLELTQIRRPSMDDKDGPNGGYEDHELQGEETLGATIHDAHDMKRLGKKQQLKRRFNFLATLGFISVYMATWEFILVSLAASLSNGGFAGIFWTFIGTVACYSSVVVSLAEMESMAPTSGGQYHWTSEFAPPKYQRFLSYQSGWMCTLGWLASTSSTFFVSTTLIEALISVYQPGFAFPNWQHTLISIAFLVVTIAFNTYAAPVLPLIQKVGLVGHLLGWFVVLIPVLVLCPKNSASEVFLQFRDHSGWDNIGTACLVSQITVLYCTFGSDSVVHISEEVSDASLFVPRAMLWSFILNVVLGFGILIALLFCIGPLSHALNVGIPYLALFQSTGSSGLAVFLILVLFVLIYFGNITCMTTASREIWAFARDRGFPFSNWICKMDEKRHVPFNAVYLTAALSGILCLINIGSVFAFNIIVSLSLLALLSTYILSIGCVLLKRINGEPLPPARWSLGKWGLPINAFAVAYSIFASVFACFPTALPVKGLRTINWAPVVWGGVIVLALLTWGLHGYRHFTAPVMWVEGRRAGDQGRRPS